MKHYGDITKLHGWDLPVVDCITGGSPCQDLSVAGNRAGLAGDRSGLFMDQIRIVKEMREHDRATGRTDINVRPRFMVWENVPGAFSSNKGRDFQAVLTEIVRVTEPDAPDVPMPKKWTKAGCLYDEMGRWSIAWRVHDAQFWGVPQRRKRIALVADFGGLSAPEVLFERKGLSWHPSENRKKRKTSAGEIDGGIEKQNEVNVAGTLDASYYKGHGATLGQERIIVLAAEGNKDTNDTETTSAENYVMATGHTNAEIMRGGCPTLNAMHEQPIMEERNAVRRLTPKECERLQGYPNDWTNIGEWTDTKGKKHKEADAPRYKALGNSIALPFWFYLLRRISAQYERPATLGSLFDGIGGFPLCWERCNGKGTALWASEIEEFPIAVTKKHFPEED